MAIRIKRYVLQLAIHNITQRERATIKARFFYSASTHTLKARKTHAERTKGQRVDNLPTKHQNTPRTAQKRTKTAHQQQKQNSNSRNTTKKATKQPKQKASTTTTTVAGCFFFYG